MCASDFRMFWVFRSGNRSSEKLSPSLRVAELSGGHAGGSTPWGGQGRQGGGPLHMCLHIHTKWLSPRLQGPQARPEERREVCFLPEQSTVISEGLVAQGGDTCPGPASQVT